MTTRLGRLIVLRISGLAWQQLDGAPAADDLRAAGTTVTALLPAPITGPQTQALQMLGGQTPGQMGFFDVVATRNYAVQPAPEPATRSLHELIAAGGHGTVAVEIDLALNDVPAYLEREAGATRYALVHTSITRDGTAGDTGDADDALNRAINAARAWVGNDGACLLVSEYHETPVEAFINLNDGLRALGVLEVTEGAAGPAIRWDETLAYHVGHGQLWINLEGREPSGIVAPRDEYDRVAEALIASLPAKLRDERTGAPVIEHIYRRHQVYAGEYLFRAPDLIVELRPGYAPSPRSAALEFDGALARPAPAGTSAAAGLNPQSVAGLAVAAGGPFAQHRVIAQAPLVGIAPTLLHALGLPLPARMDGEVLTEMFSPEFLAHVPVRRGADESQLSQEDEAEVLARLKSLGYVG